MRSGQSLIELLIAIAIGVILLVGAIMIISPALTTNANTERARVSAALGKELLENTRVIAAKDWNVFAALATSSANRFYINSSSSPFIIATGTESVLVATTSYQRYFYLDDVYRNSSGKIDGSGVSLDPSTRKVTIVYTWPPNNASNTIITYLTRYADKVIRQTNWSGGSGQDGPITATGTNNRFASSSNIEFTSTTGSLKLLGY